MAHLPLVAIVVDADDLTVTYASHRAVERGIPPGARPFGAATADLLTARRTTSIRIDDADVTMSITVLPDGAGLLIVEQADHGRDVAKLLQMIDSMPVAVMTADPDDDFRINYLNRGSGQIMQRVARHLPVPVENILGSSIDLFHADGHHQRSHLADPCKLPIKGRIRLGDEYLAFDATAIIADDGRYLGPMISWKLVTEEVQLSNTVSGMADQLARSFERLNDEAAGLRSRARSKAGVVQDLTDAADRMDKVLKVISDRVAHAAQLANRIIDQATSTSEFVTSLEENAERIEHMSLAIGRIAGQTNLLALNATIEAARAGEAGRGFTVVAGEVKSLAAETARTSAEIGAQLSGMRSATAMTAGAIRSITDQIAELVGVAGEVQRANIDQAVSASAVNRTISEVRVAADDSERAADVVSGLAKELSRGAEGLQTKLTAFLP
ncbi:methyl-accepting chemotaxis protein [Sphingomonas jinjuensis]|nr:methyl-accepting chemotaxis protein [Sphingomonas jinjuensis]